ncbi:CaiB/BaiF CoA transferase family protein [Micromonospora inositola]|uniref:Formyl-CoA transferase n=1 Tax=Micromonospora inositola TaxID=47865 RepID=A0A1C5K594_9ACTN|nr:CoA transferase [Micromonospora inositola]SCG77925.1 formyl-CoA transferase [Micromonospora inositola]
MADHEERCAVGPLTGIRVLEFAHVVSAPLCGMLLADLGADVVKVESPHRPDMLRGSGARGPDGDSMAFRTVNRNKRAVSLDLADEASTQMRDDLIRSADVLLENYSPGVPVRLGIDYERVRDINPRLVYASISGFGDEGPLRELGGYDFVAQAMSGLMSVTGPSRGVPYKIGVPVSDIASALYLTIGVLAALRARDECGHGQRVSCSLLAAGVSLGVWEASHLWATGEVPGRLGNAHRALAPYEAVRASDGWFVIAANTDAMFRRAATAFGREEWLDDPRFATNATRLAHRDALSRELRSAASAGPADLWVRLLREAGVPAGELLDVAQALDHPQVTANGMVAHVTDERTGRSTKVLGNPLRLSHTPVSYRRSAPGVGEHDDALFGVDPGTAATAPAVDP